MQQSSNSNQTSHIAYNNKQAASSSWHCGKQHEQVCHAADAELTVRLATPTPKHQARGYNGQVLQAMILSESCWSNADHAFTGVLEPVFTWEPKQHDLVRTSLTRPSRPSNGMITPLSSECIRCERNFREDLENNIENISNSTGCAQVWTGF